jgi:hypothetical protein
MPFVQVWAAYSHRLLPLVFFFGQVGTDVLDNCLRTADLNGVSAANALDDRGVVVRELDWFNPRTELVADIKQVDLTSTCLSPTLPAEHTQITLSLPADHTQITLPLPADHAHITPTLSADHTQITPTSSVDHVQSAPTHDGAPADELSTDISNRGVTATITTAGTPPYSWESADVECFRSEATILLAADTVYSDRATTAFGRCAQQLLAAPGPSRTLYITLQKRINFSLDELAVVAPAYDHFLRVVVALPGLKADRMNTDAIPQVFAYARTPELELWRVTKE